MPEVPDDPALVPAVLADAGYFESLAVTDEDRERTAQYQENRAREQFVVPAPVIWKATCAAWKCA